MARNNCGFSPYVGRNVSHGLDGRFRHMLVRDGGLTRDMHPQELLPLCPPQLPTPPVEVPPVPLARMGWQNPQTNVFAATNSGAITIAGDFVPNGQTLNFSVFENFVSARHTVTHQFTAAVSGFAPGDIASAFNYNTSTGLGSVSWAPTTTQELVPGTGVLTLRDTVLNIDLGTLTYSVNESGFYDGLLWTAYAAFVPVP